VTKFTYEESLPAGRQVLMLRYLSALLRKALQAGSFSALGGSG